VMPQPIARHTYRRSLHLRIKGFALLAFGDFVISRSPAVEQGRKETPPNRSRPAVDAVLALCIAAGTSGNKCRAAPTIPDARPARASGLYEKPESDLRTGSC